MNHSERTDLHIHTNPAVRTNECNSSFPLHCLIMSIARMSAQHLWFFHISTSKCFSGGTERVHSVITFPTLCWTFQAITNVGRDLVSPLPRLTCTLRLFRIFYTKDKRIAFHKNLFCLLYAIPSFLIWPLYLHGFFPEDKSFNQDFYTSRIPCPLGCMLICVRVF